MARTVYIYTPYMTVKYRIHTVYIWLWPALLRNFWLAQTSHLVSAFQLCYHFPTLGLLRFGLLRLDLPVRSSAAFTDPATPFASSGPCIVQDNKIYWTYNIHVQTHKLHWTYNIHVQTHTYRPYNDPCQLLYTWRVVGQKTVCARSCTDHLFSAQTQPKPLPKHFFILFMLMHNAMRKLQVWNWLLVICLKTPPRPTWGHSLHFYDQAPSPPL